MEELGPPRGARPDPALAAAAEELARVALVDGLAAATSPERLRLALGRAGSFAPELHPFAVRATSRGAALERLRHLVEASLASEATPFSQAGAGEAAEGSDRVLVLLLARSWSELEAIAPSQPLGVLQLRGSLHPSLSDPRLHVINPMGSPSRHPLATWETRLEGDGADEASPAEEAPPSAPLPNGEGGSPGEAQASRRREKPPSAQLPAGLEAPGTAQAFEGRLHLDRPGRWILEIVGSGAEGPVVAALQTIWVGQAPPSPWSLSTAAEVGSRSAADPAAEELALAARINDLRGRQGLGPLLVDPILGAVARSFAEELRDGGHLAHHSRRSGAVADRLRRAGYAWEAVGENLAQASDVSQAQRSLESSPRHLELLLGADWRAAGYGVAFGVAPSGAPTVHVVTIVAIPR